MADKYLELIDDEITEREVITYSHGWQDAGKLIGLGNDGRLDMTMMPKDVATTLNPADHAFLLGLDYASAGHTGFEPAVTKGNLTASVPLYFDNTRQVIGGAAGVSLKNNAVDPAAITAIDIGVLASSDTVVPTSQGVVTAISTHAALITGVHGLVFTAGKTLTLTESLTLNALPVGGLAVATGANILGSLAVGLTTQILVGGGAGTVPAWGTDIPTAVTIGTKYIYRAEGTDVPVADGGTGVSTFALNGILYGNAANAIGVTAIGAAGQILRVGASPFVPTWTTATYPATTTAYQLLVSTAANVIGELAVGATGKLLMGATGAVPIWTTPTFPNAATTTGAYLRADGTNFIQSTLVLPNAATAFRLPVATSANTIGELAAVGATGQYLAGATGAIPAFATLNQAAVADLTTADGPTLAHLHISDLAAIYTAAESWVGPSSTTGVYFKGGNVGIGTTGPLGKLDIQGSSALFRFNTAGTELYNTNAGTVKIYTSNAASNLALSAGGRDVGDLFIDSTGKVGIGTASPGQKVTISMATAGDTTLGLYNTTSHSNNRNWLFGTNQSVYGDFHIVAGASEGAAPTLSRFVIDRSGNVGIGMITPGSKFHVRGSGNTGATTPISIENSDGATLFAISDNGYTTFGPTLANVPAARFLINTSTLNRGFQLYTTGALSTSTSGDSLSMYHYVDNVWAFQSADSTTYRHIALNPLGGNVSIGSFGLTEPLKQLEIIATIGGTLRLSRNDTNVTPEEEIGVIDFYTNDSDGPHTAAFLKSVGAETYGRKGALTFGVSKTNNADAVEVARIDEFGNFGVGMSPIYRLDVTGNFRCSTGFGCNGTTPQTAYVSGGGLAAYATGAFGLDSDANMMALHALVARLRACLVANGIMS